MSALLESPPPARSDPQATLAPLSLQLASADRVLQQEKGARLVLRAWPWVLGYIVAAFVADVLLHLAAGPRVALIGGFVSVIAGILIAGACVAWIRRNSLEHTARILEQRDARLGSKLINILQLHAQTADRSVAPLTRELAGMAIAGYVEEFRTEDLPKRASTDGVKSQAKRTGWALAGFAGLLGIFLPITRVELPRFLDPFGDHPPYSFTQLEISEPGDDAASVVYGQSILITAKSRGHRPGELFLSYFTPENPAAKTTVPMFDKGERGFTQQIEGIKTNLVIFAHTKNGHSLSRQRRVSVILTPKLEKSFVTVAPPAYTGLAAEERALQLKSLKALEGSTLTFRLLSNRPLSSGHITVDHSAGTVIPITMDPSGENEVTGSFVAKESARLVFSLIDRDGFESQETLELALTVTHDLAPEVQITNPNGDAFVAMDVKVQPVIEASDDYGLATIRIHQARNGKFTDPRLVRYAKPPLHSRETLTLDLAKMELQSGDTLSFFAEAIDNAPEPHLVRSKTVTLTVISVEEYNDFLRERTDMKDIEAKYTKLIADMQELVAQQKQIGREVEALQQALAEAKDGAEKAAAQKKLAELTDRQQQLNEKLNQLADTMQNFVRDQPLYDLEAELQDTLAEKAQEIRESTAANEKSMEDIGGKPPGGEPSAGKSGQSAPSQKMLGEFKKASDEQLAKLGAAEEEMEEKVAEPLADLSLMHEIIKDINRFKELYEAQKELAGQAKAFDKAGPLSREDQIALKAMAAMERQIGNELDAVEQKLWEDGKAAMEKFPKAGKSAQHLAQQMGDLRLQSLANQTTAAMLEGNGSQGAQLAENLRSEMDKLFCQCDSQSSGMNSELDQYLGIQRSMNPGKSFRQMMQTRRFGAGGKPGFGAMGNGGGDGFAVMKGPNVNVMGNESPITQSDKSQLSGAARNNAAVQGATASAAIDKQDVVQGMQPVNRESEAVQGESGIEQYSGLVDQYFKAITKPQPPKKP